MSDPTDREEPEDYEQLVEQLVAGGTPRWLAEEQAAVASGALAPGVLIEVTDPDGATREVWSSELSDEELEALPDLVTP